MDYSSLSHDPEHPADVSPWGSSSPRADRTFSAGDMPSSPLPPQHDSPYTDFPDNMHRSTTGGPDSPGLSERLHGTHIDEANYGEGRPGWANSQPPHNQAPARSQLPARYQVGVRQQGRQNALHFRLHAKITALERTGKKDPILRFDVHVRHLLLVPKPLGGLLTVPL